MGASTGVNACDAFTHVVGMGSTQGTTGGGETYTFDISEQWISNGFGQKWLMIVVGCR